MVRILIDMLFFSGGRGGTETYAREIVKRLPAVLPDAEFTAIANRAGAATIKEFFPGDVITSRWVGGDRISWAAGEVALINARARRAAADVIWSPANFAPITSSSVPRVTTTHDVTYHEAAAGGLSGGVARLSAWLMSKAALTSDQVIVGSHAAKDSVVERIGVATDRITVIPHGTNAPVVPPDPWREIASLGIAPGRPIVLSTGNRLPHKNFETVLAAVASMSKSDRPLVVLPGGRGADPLVPLAKQLDVESDVLPLGWVTSAQLESLYACASLYVCPSLTEGFGLPVVDAMRRGCLVLANDVPVLREVGGDAALYVDARSPETLAEAILQALRVDHVEQRAAALERASLFTWERSAEATGTLLAATAHHLLGD